MTEHDLNIEISLTPTYEAEIFQDVTGQWWWRLIAKNGKVVANSAEGYRRKSHARKMLYQIIGAAELYRISVRGE